MKYKLLALLTMITVSLGFASAANAALIGVVDHGTYFTDTTNGLDWLDVTASVNRSYTDVNSQFGSGGDFEGWRYASAAEFGAMWDAITGEATGINGPGQTSSAERGVVIDEVIDLLGDTFDSFYQHNYGMSYCDYSPSSCPDGDLRYTVGILADTLVNDTQAYAYIYDDDRNAGSPDIVTTEPSIDMNTQAWNIGSFLVRSTTAVPEPGTILLLAAGLAGIGVTRRSKYHR